MTIATRSAENALAEVLREFPADFASTDPAELAEYGRDWTRVTPPAALALVRPRSTEEVSRFLRACARTGLAVVPSGGRTGLAGGAVAHQREVVLTLERMRALGPVDTLGMTVRVEAGATTEAVHQHAAVYGLTWPVDFASKGSSTVGGNIATNAGGLRVIRYGVTRPWVLGLTVVLANGTILELAGALEKNNTGVDLKHLFIGSEGTLGVITAATLKLTRAPSQESPVMLFALQDLAAVLRLFESARRQPFTLCAFEFFTAQCAARLERHRGISVPFESRASHYVLLELEHGDPENVDRWVESLFVDGLVLDGTRSASLEQAQRLWVLREGISEALAATGLPHKNDIALPLAELSSFCARLEALLAERYPGYELCLFGHIGDGNLHVNIMKPDALPKAEFHAKTREVDDAVFTLVAAHHGSISAEHGIGLLKRPYLHYSRSPEELALMRALKATLDPDNILNPGKVLEPRS